MNKNSTFVYTHTSKLNPGSYTRNPKIRSQFTYTHIHSSAVTLSDPFTNNGIIDLSPVTALFRFSNKKIEMGGACCAFA